MHRVLLTAGLLGRLFWLLGNTVEVWRRSVERWADHPPRSLLAPGRPPFFYLVVGPPTVVATIGDLLVGPPRPARVVSAVSTAAALSTAVVLVRTVVLPLRAGTTERDDAVRRWYRLNRVRMALVVVALGADVHALVRS